MSSPYEPKHIVPRNLKFSYNLRNCPPRNILADPTEIECQRKLLANLKRDASEPKSLKSEIAADSDSSEDFIECICGNQADCELVIACDGKACMGINKWFHIDCVGMTQEQWKSFNSGNAGQWFCPSCSQSNKRFEQTRDHLEK